MTVHKTCWSLKPWAVLKITSTVSERCQSSFCWLYRNSRPEVFCKIGVLKNLSNITGKRLCHSLFPSKAAGLRPATLLKKRLWHRYFLVNFENFLWTPFLTEHLQWLLVALTKNLCELAFSCVKAKTNSNFAVKCIERTSRPFSFYLINFVII